MDGRSRLRATLAHSVREDDVETALDDCFSRAVTNLAVRVGEPDAGNGRLGEQVSLYQRARHAWRENSADTGDAEDNRPHRAVYRIEQGTGLCTGTFLFGQPNLH